MNPLVLNDRNVHHRGGLKDGETYEYAQALFFLRRGACPRLGATFEALAPIRELFPFSKTYLKSIYSRFTMIHIGIRTCPAKHRSI